MKKLLILIALTFSVNMLGGCGPSCFDITQGGYIECPVNGL